MKWFLEEKYLAAKNPIHFGDGAVFLGSCFSQNIYGKGQRLGFNFKQTRFGTIFHPIPIARILLEALKNTESNRIVENNGRFFSWDATTKLYADSEANIQAILDEERLKLRENLKEAKYLFLTFGSAKGYINTDKLVVANCHKVSSSQFEVEISEVDQLVYTYKKLIEILQNYNPGLEIVLTVSPVRHSKDGLVENNRSKSRLLLLCEELARIEKVSYFPAYELVIDQLRDYRFYSSDLVHPNKEAIDYVWNIFEEVYFKQTTKEISAKVDKFRSYFDHIPIHKENQRDTDVRFKKESELKSFLTAHSEIIW
jgi:lysophospholipase L1-like esterase